MVSCHHHNHHHDHEGHHGGGHHHAPNNFGRAFSIGIGLNIAFVVGEIIYGLQANSLALLADAGHNASDVLGLFMAWGAFILAKSKPSERYSYGLQSSSIIAALANAVLLLLACGGIGWEALQRFSHPEPITASTVMLVAGVGVFVNGITAWLFMGGRHDDLNIKGAFLHMAADAAISLGVVASAALSQQTGWLWLDPLVSFSIAVIIIVSTWQLLKSSANLALHATPEHIDVRLVKNYLGNQEGVSEVHDLHIWAMSTTNNALSAHLIMPNGHPGDGFIQKITHELAHLYHIHHATIQIELGDSVACSLAPDHVV
ncbi:MAG: cation diffusion facilitator family transporter [Alphaproteobacteria bacterium]